MLSYSINKLKSYQIQMIRGEFGGHTAGEEASMTGGLGRLRSRIAATWSQRRGVSIFSVGVAEISN